MLEHLRVATRPRWVGFTVLVGGLFVVFVLLGRWQLHRADEQRRDDAVRETARSAPAVSVDHVTQPGTPPDSDNEWRAVTARGTYDQEHQLLVRNRSLNAKNGYLVLVPLQTDSGPDLVVVRGWIPSGSTAEAPDALPAVPVGIVTVAGRLRLPEPTVGASELPVGQVERVVPDEVAALTGRPTYGGWVVLGTEEPPATSTTAVTTLPDGSVPGGRWPISHTVYAGQWFIFAVIALVGWVILLRRDVRAERAPAVPETANHEA